MRRTYEEVATLNGQSALCMFFDMEKFFDCVFVQPLRSSIGAELSKTTALHCYASVPQRTNLPCRRNGGAKHTALHWHTGWLLLVKQVCEDGTLQHSECVNKTLPTQLPRPVEKRHFVEDLTTMSVANSESLAPSALSPWNSETN